MKGMGRDCDLRWSLSARGCVLALAVAMVGVGAGCGGGTMKMVVEPSREANEGRPLRMLVRSVDKKTYLEEPYEAVAGKVIAPDASVLAAEVVFPGRRREIKVKRPKEGAVGVYMMFLRPGQRWKLLLEPPLPSRVRLWVEANRIGRTEVR